MNTAEQKIIEETLRQLSTVRGAVVSSSFAGLALRQIERDLTGLVKSETFTHEFRFNSNNQLEQKVMIGDKEVEWRIVPVPSLNIPEIDFAAMEREMIAEMRELLGRGYIEDYYIQNTAGFMNVAKHYLTNATNRLIRNEPTKPVKKSKNLAAKKKAKKKVR